MARLKNTTGGLTIGAGEVSQTFIVSSDKWHIYLSGDADSSTLTLQVSTTGIAGSFKTYVTDDITGTPASQAFTVSHVASTTTMYRRVFLDHGVYFRFVAAEGTPAWVIEVTGNHVHVLP